MFELPVSVFYNKPSVDICIASNGSNGSIIAGTSGGNAPYTWQWSNGTAGLLNTGLTPGDYTVVVTDANGCSASADQ